MAWTSCASPKDLVDELQRLLGLAEDPGELPEVDMAKLRLLFAPTGASQETSVSSGWGEEFVDLANRFDLALGDR